MGQLTWSGQLLSTQDGLIHIHVLEKLIKQSLAAQLLLLVRELLAIAAADESATKHQHCEAYTLLYDSPRLDSL